MGGPAQTEKIAEMRFRATSSGAIFSPVIYVNAMFGKFFCGVFFDCVLASVFGLFLEAPHLKNQAPASTGARFLQNRRFPKKLEKPSILAPFSEVKSKKIRSKITSPNTLIFDIDFYAIFYDFSSILGSQNPSKIAKNKKN